MYETKLTRWHVVSGVECQTFGRSVLQNAVIAQHRLNVVVHVTHVVTVVRSRNRRRRRALHSTAQTVEY